MKILTSVLLLTVLHPSFQISESFTTSVRLAGRTERFKCSFQLVYTSRGVHLGKSHLYCATDIRATGEKLYILAPSGYRFSLVVDMNPTTIRRARVLVPTLTYARTRANDPFGARFSSLAGPDDWNGINPLFVWNGDGNWTRWTWDGQRTQHRAVKIRP